MKKIGCPLNRGFFGKEEAFMSGPTKGKKFIMIGAISLWLIALSYFPAQANVDYAKETEKLCVHCHVDILYPGHSFYEAESTYKWIFMWICCTVSALIFAYGMSVKILIWRMGKKDKDKKKIPIWKYLWRDALLQKGILQISQFRWVNYLTLSLGFTALLVVMLGTYLSLIFFDTRTFLIPGLGGRILDGMIDFLGLAILVGVILSAARRYFSPFKSPYLQNAVEDNVALFLIFLIVTTGFLLEAFRIAVLPISSHHIWSFGGFALAMVIRDLPFSFATYHFYLWIIHFLAAFVFIAYIPYSKFAHVLTCPVTAVVSRRGE